MDASAVSPSGGTATCNVSIVGEVKYVSRVRIERVRGALRRAEIPGESEPVYFGVHDEIAEHYGVAAPGDDERATTLDYIVAAAGG